jgi:maltose regulon regulatory protein malI
LQCNSKISQKSNTNFVTGYALNFCKFHIYKVPYNHNVKEEGMKMAQNRIRIVDVADALGLSTATVSNVIHGKTEKISDQTVKRVQQELESLRAKAAIECLEAMRDGTEYQTEIVLPVDLIKRESTRKLSCQSL